MVIVLSVIKIAAVVFLVLALLCVAVLLVPVFYTFDGDTESKSCKLCVDWFFRLIRFRFQYRGKAEAVLKILFFRLDFTDPEKNAKRKERKAEKAKKKKKKKRRKAARRRQSTKRKRTENRGEKLREDGGTAETADRNSSGCHTGNGFHETGSAGIPEGSGSGANQEAEEQQKNGLLEKVSKALPILKAVCEYDVPEAVMPALQILLYRIRPRKLQGYAEFGFADPAYTGQLLGAVSMVPFLFGTDFTVTPDFEAKENHVEGVISVQGRIQVIFLMIFLIRLIANKQVRGFLSALRRQRKRRL